MVEIVEVFISFSKKMKCHLVGNEASWSILQNLGLYSRKNCVNTEFLSALTAVLWLFLAAGDWNNFIFGFAGMTAALSWMSVDATVMAPYLQESKEPLANSGP